MATTKHQLNSEIRAELVRPDYWKHTRWTYAEAAHEAGVSIATVRNWYCQGKFKQGYAVGNLRVDADSFLKYLQTGRAQG